MLILDKPNLLRELAQSKPRILLVGSSPDRLAWLNRALASDYDVKSSSEPYSVVDLIAARAPRLVVVQLDPDDGSGLQVLRAMPRPGRGRPPTIAIGRDSDPRLGIARTKQLADVYLSLPVSEARILSSAWRILDEGAKRDWDSLPPAQRNFLKNSLAGFNELSHGIVHSKQVKWEAVQRCARAVQEATGNAIAVETLKHLATFHHQTFVHAMRVSTTMALFGADLGLRERDLSLLIQAGLLHDASINLMPKDVIHKPGDLDDAEWRMMRDHPLVSKKILEANGEVPEAVIKVALNHHERLDGSGYPHGLKGAQIDDLSMICAIADMYAALTTRRPHRPALSSRDALGVMKDQAGTSLDSSFFKRFENVASHLDLK